MIREAESILRDNILSFWMGLDDNHGGYYGRVAGDGTPDRDADRGAVLYARILWAFSAAFRQTKDRKYLLPAIKAKDYLTNHFTDNKYGGIYWSVDCNGERKDTKAQLYAQAFAIYGLSEYFAATSDDEALKYAINIYKVVESNFADSKNGGYIEALSRDFRPLDDMRLSDKDSNAIKTMNSHLHLLEAYANLYKVWPDESLKQNTENLLAILRDRIFDKVSGHLNLYFIDDWAVCSKGISYGHDIETSWLALECALSLKDFKIVDSVKEMCRRLYFAGMEGWNGNGSLVYEIREDGSLDDSRQWWVQAEALVANLWAWKYLDIGEGASNAQKIFGYIKSHLIDTDGGEWFWGCSADGVADRDNDKAGPWKCPYHNSRACLQVMKIFD